MSTTSVAPRQQRSSSGRTTPRRPSRHCALDDASFDDLVAMGQNIEALSRQVLQRVIDETATSYDDATAFLRRWRSTVANWAGNLINYSDTAYDLLIYAAEITASNAGREACLHDAEELLLNSCGVVPLYYGGVASQLADGLTGVYGNALGVYFFDSVTAE